ncbi:MAG: acyl-CoA thioesterase [Rhodobacteraceae bacterium]|nr:acyl-CoA thioesterase [Paracoccaceae bacterium]
MYPLLRFAKEAIAYRARPLDLLATHVSHHRCWPWDLDPWMELNNGRTLTLYDLGRIPLMTRTGLVRAAFGQGWGITVAGSTVRYRRRIRAFQRFEMHSRLLGWDTRFVYFEQAMWRRGEALNHVLIRMATTDAQGIVPPVRLMEAMGQPAASPPLPGWVDAWIAADAQRPWPPQV